jgi:hypothetical protein
MNATAIVRGFVRITTMRVFLMSCAAAAFLAFGAALALNFVQKQVDVAYTTSSVRI